MTKSTYFYTFLEPVSKELAFVARELENSVFTSPRTMLTHARVFVENILQQVMKLEKLKEEPRMTLKERLDILSDHGILTAEVSEALHQVRQLGNQAAHDARMFRFSEALLSWEALFKVVKWYVEVYAPLSIEVPDYQDPASPKEEKKYDISELEARLKGLEELLKASMQKGENNAEKEVADSTEAAPLKFEEPGITTIRKISYKGDKVEVPYFLRDAFLLPQRFPKSEMFLIRLGAEQQARIMSELPSDIENLHKHVKRYTEENDRRFFYELKDFIAEEKVRREVVLQRQGELLLFYKVEHLVLTNKLKEIPLTTEAFKGVPSLIRQLNEDGMHTVGQLPKELVILGKYKNVGVVNVGKLFEQLGEYSKN
ncbi:transposase [Sutcliffiella cohnii]|uniref:Transposase n=1 Tax=Sutcliffiella cohnii TaxID=33932 RepID=A0A223KNB3_9BACI|nr:DUF4145 domain-containing protein [Sutcliffiella cohnii]AST90972.1 transposase [Sutcliffiella cohnii]